MRAAIFSPLGGNPEQETPARPRFDAVVVGASAGGVDALKALLPSLPASYPLPVIVVLHVPADRPSLLTEVFAPQCAIRVVEAEDKEPIDQGGAVYFAPPGYHLIVDDRHRLSLSVEQAVNWSRPSIDLLFCSAAAVFGRRLLGVLLTGASADGAEGLLRVHDTGGCTVVQDPATALVRAMPEAALARFQPDHVLDLEGIAALLGAAGAPVLSPSDPSATAGATT